MKKQTCNSMVAFVSPILYSFICKFNYFRTDGFSYVKLQVWDVLSNDEVVSVVVSAKNKEAAAKAVVDEAHAAWKRKFPLAKIDDCTVVCLFLEDREDNLFPPTT